MYEIEGRSTEDFKMQAREVAGDELPEVEKLLDAISEKPSDLNGERYSLCDLNSDLRLSIRVPVYQARIKRTGFTITYTVDKYKQVVRIETMQEGSWLYNLKNYLVPRLGNE